MALTELGFERPTFDEILEAQTSRAKTLFGETIDTSELTALGKYIRINATDIDTLYQTLEGVYYARFPNTSNGVSLDRLCPFAGITRNAATFARHTITITGTPLVTISSGFEVSNTNQSVIFHTIDDYTISSEGTVTAYVDCNEAGSIGNVTVGTINTIVNPLADVDSITHTAIAKSGEDTESDADLRSRFTDTVAGTGSGTAKSIKAAVMRVANVDDCYIVENATDQTVGNCAPYSFESIVLYDGETSTKQLIAEAIFSKKPIGIATSGINSLTVKDEANVSHTVKFTDTTKVYIYLTCIVYKNSQFQADGVDKIKNQIMDYVNSLGNGEDVYISQLYACINATGVNHVGGLGIRKATESGNVADNITIANDEVARIRTDLIDITVRNAT